MNQHIESYLLKHTNGSVSQLIKSVKKSISEKERLKQKLKSMKAERKVIDATVVEKLKNLSDSAAEIRDRANTPIEEMDVIKNEIFGH